MNIKDEIRKIYEQATQIRLITEEIIDHLPQEKENEDYLDRFSEVVKGLGLSRKIANKLANFWHYEIQMAIKKAKESSHFSKPQSELVKALEDYIVLLGKELDEVVSMASVHGWKSSRFEEGKKMREKIDALNKDLTKEDRK